MESKALLGVKKPDQVWLESYFSSSLLQARAYKIDAAHGVEIKLDQNESPWDWPKHIKAKILDRVAALEWNRYPDSMAGELTQILARYLRVAPGCLLTSPGSNHMISLVLEGLASHAKGKVVIARPSFALFEAYAQYLDIAYEVWPLDENFQYQRSLLPSLPEGSIVFFASPNNPTGNSLSKAEFTSLLESYPKVLFIADEAYYEFDEDPYTDLLSHHSNLLILRTLSKTLGAAGVRIGYALGAPELIRELGKLRLPYLLNHFAIEAAKAILEDPEMQSFMTRNIANARSEREKLFAELKALNIAGFEVFNSKANFLLMRWREVKKSQDAYQSLLERGVLIRNVSGGPGLQGCLRVSIGTPQENSVFLNAMKNLPKS